MAQIPHDTPQPISQNLQRIAWAVMLAAFMLFCVLCFVTVYGTYLFLFQSTVPMTAIAQASRGSIGVTGLDLRENVERGARALAPGNIVRPNDSESQGVIVVKDPYIDNQFVASITLMGDAAASLRSAIRPRFEWGGSVYRIEMGRVTGQIEVQVASDLPRGLEISLFTEQHARVLMTDAGRYMIDIRAATITVESDGGTALIYGPDKSIGYSVTSGSGSIYSISDDDLRVLPPVNALLANSDFSLVVPSDSIYAPMGWVCGHTINPPRDVFTVEESNGRRFFRMTRGGGATSNGETSCTQGLGRGGAWQDIADYDTLSLNMSIYIEHQSLGSCGERGSECPLMLRIGYINEAGDAGEILYGFYATPAPPERQFPQTCESCYQSHIRIQEKIWYIFDSGNMLAGFTPALRPMAISYVRFYASGHEYDVRVGYIDLVAGN